MGVRGAEVGRSEIIPLAQRLWSEKADDTASLVLTAARFTAVRLGTQAKLKILALKRVLGIPDSRYDALADGIQTILRRIGKGPVHQQNETGRLPQRNSFFLKPDLLGQLEKFFY